MVSHARIATGNTSVMFVLLMQHELALRSKDRARVVRTTARP